jgi:hypothetical protein
VAPAKFRQPAADTIDAGTPDLRRFARHFAWPGKPYRCDCGDSGPAGRPPISHLDRTRQNALAVAKRACTLADRARAVSTMFTILARTRLPTVVSYYGLQLPAVLAGCVRSNSGRANVHEDAAAHHVFGFGGPGRSAIVAAGPRRLACRRGCNWPWVAAIPMPAWAVTICSA